MKSVESEHQGSGSPGSQALRRIAAAGAPAVMWTALGCPFDVLKTRLQTAEIPFASPLRCLRWTVRREGVIALWKGSLPQILLSTPYSVIMFGVYDWLLPKLGGDSNPIANSFVAGAASGIAVTAIHNPLEVWRVRVQTHLKPRGGNLSTNRSVLRGLAQHPVQCLAGVSMTLVENVVGNSVYFGANELLRRRMFAQEDGSGHLRLGEEALAGALTGIIFKIVIYPANLIKARMMTTDGIRARQVVRNIWAADGARGFYRGASVMILRAALINAAGLPAWKWAQRRLGLSP